MLRNTGSTATAPAAPEQKKHQPNAAVPESKAQLVPASDRDLSFNCFSKLHPRIFSMVASFWNQRDAGRFRCAGRHCALTLASMPMPRQFKFLVNAKAGKLLNAVVDADYEQAGSAWNSEENLPLMFEPVNFIYRGTSERISPLQYAFKVSDTYMWYMFYLKIKGTEWEAKFGEQKREQEQKKIPHIDLAPLWAACDKFAEQHRCWLLPDKHEDKITDEQFDAAITKLDAEKKKYMLMHMWKEFSRKEDTWRANSTFEVDKVKPLPPRNCRIYDYTQGWRPLGDAVAGLGTGVAFSLVRGAGSCAAGRSGRGLHWHDSMGVVEDTAIFRRLYEVRTKDPAKLLPLQLQVSLEKNLAPETQSLPSSPASRAAP